MWLVESNGAENDKTLKIGVVADADGFYDSPETEVISGGVSTKGLDAVAIARHGNYMFWGFASSPENMTVEAQDVLTNAIIYTSTLKGERIIARKYYPSVMTRDYADEIYDKLNDYESMRVFPSSGKRLYGIFEQFEGQPQKAQEFIVENRDYFYGGNGLSLNYIIDEDAKSLKIANNDHRLLDKAISLWENEEDIAKAKRILDRYSLCTFETAAEWRAWYNSNKDKLFFTENGGWYFLVNDMGNNVVGNDYKAKAVYIAAKRFKPIKVDINDAAKLQAKLVTLDGGSQAIVIKLNIIDGYHAYDVVEQGEVYMPTSFNFKLPEGCSLGEFVKPESRLYYEDGETSIYEGSVIFVQYLNGYAKDGSIIMEYNYQVCDHEGCKNPVESSMIL